MPITVDSRGNEFLEWRTVNEREIGMLRLDAPLTHALIVVRCEERCLLMLNKYRACWELPGGIIEAGESPRQCILRELYEETRQTVDNLEFAGLMKFHLQPGYQSPERIEYGALFSGAIGQVEEFHETEEAAGITWWDMQADIGFINEIDRKLIEYAWR